MERDANYAVIGAFVVLVIAMAGLFVYWYSDTRDHREITRYEIYFEGSVSGLNKGGAVRYLGVDVGRVKSLRVDRRASSRVQVIVDLDSETPISERTLAELSLQGVTGLLYIDLFENTTHRLAMPAAPSERYPVIRSARSNFDIFLSSLPNLLNKLAEVGERAALMMSDKNIDALTRTFVNIDQSAARLPQTLSEIQSLVRDLRGTAGELGESAASVHKFVDDASPELSATIRRAHEIADRLASTSDHLDQLLAENRDDIRTFARDGLPQFEEFVREGRAAALEFRELSHSLRENPSQLL
ncbi:MAG TPA: MlaD family protein, partial [Steroidobacteraceae bacterium]